MFKATIITPIQRINVQVADWNELLRKARWVSWYLRAAVTVQQGDMSQYITKQEENPYEVE